VQRFAQATVPGAELSKAKNRELASYWREQATISGKASALGEYAVFNGDYRKLFAAPAAFEQVSAEQVRDLAQRVLQANNRTVGVIRAAKPAESTKKEQAR